MRTPNEKRCQLRALLDSDGIIVAPGVYDCLTAKLVEQAEFQVAIVTGAGVAASLLGVPDVGLTTMSETLTQTRNIAQAIDIPTIADCDTGYGSPINVMRTVREFEAAGVAALFIEDQVAPKRCGHFDGKQIISTEDMVQKLRAAVDARTDKDLVLIARTDARAVAGPAEAVRRAIRYAEAGAEMLFIEAPASIEEVTYLADSVRSAGVPLMINLVEGGVTPLVPVDELGEIGFKLVTFSGSLQKTAITAMKGLLDSLATNGTVDEYFPSRMASLRERSNLLELPTFFQLEARYASA